MPTPQPVITTRPPQVPHFKVTDEESFDKALPLIAEGPCMIACVSGRDHYTNDFDEAASIISDELSIGGWCTVYPGKVEINYKKPKETPSPEPPKSNLPIALVKDEASFDKAAEMIGNGPVDIQIGNEEHKGVTDFDEAMELITGALLYKIHPIVTGQSTPEQLAEERQREQERIKKELQIRKENAKIIARMKRGR